MSAPEKVNPAKSTQRQLPQQQRESASPAREDGGWQIVDNPHVGGGAMSVEEARAEGKGLWLQRKGQQPVYRTPFMVQMHGGGPIKSSRQDGLPAHVSRPNWMTQQKPKLGQPGDAFEQEADQVAERVVNGESKQMAISGGDGTEAKGKDQAISGGNPVQRKGGNAANTGKEGTQRKGRNAAKGSAEGLQRKEEGAAEAPEHIGDKLQTRKGAGQPLPPDTQERMEGAIGADFSGVRVHTDGEAKGLSKDLNAHAFTHGNDIYFNEGKYNPGTTEGDRLLAHELTHTVQQGAAPAVQRKADEREGGDESGKSRPELVEGIGVGQGADDERSRMKAERPATLVAGRQRKGLGIQRKVDYSPTNDGDAPRQRLEQKQTEGIDEDKLAEGKKMSRKDAKKEAGKADPAEKAKKRKENNQLAKPDVDNPGRQKEKTKEASKETKGKVDNPPELTKKDKDAGKDKKKAKKQEVTPEATEAEAMRVDALAAAASVEEPDSPPPVETPDKVEYRDSKGNPLPPDTQAETLSQGLVEMAQMIRSRGFAFRKEAAVALRQAHQSEAAWMEHRKNLSISEHYLGLGGKNLGQRKELVALAEQAHEKAEERADTVLREVPKKLEETRSGLDSTGPVAKDTEEQKAANAGTASEDEESNAKSKEQGGGLSSAGDKVSSINSGIEGADKELTQLQEKTVESKAKNAESKAKIVKTKGDLQVMDDQVGQMNQVNQKGRKALAATKKDPAAMKKEAKQLNRKGESLIEASQEMEGKLKEAAKNRAKRNPTVPAPKPDQGEAVQTKSAGGIIQREQGDYARDRKEKDIDATPDEQLTKEELEIKERNRQELANIRAMIGDRNMADISAAEKISIGLRARFSRFGGWVSDQFTFANVGKLFIDLINPVNWVKWMAGGIPGGLMMVVGGVKGLIDNFGFNWATVKALADIATGVAVVAATVAGISIAISAINAVLVFLTFGGWLSVAVPMAPILANIISWSGTIAFWAGAIGLTLNLIALGKSLLDVGAVSSAEQLQAQMNDVEEDSGRALQAALSMEVGASVMGQTGKLIPQQMLNSARPYAVIAAVGGRGAAMKAFLADTLAAVPAGLWAMMTFRATRRKVAGGARALYGNLKALLPSPIKNGVITVNTPYRIKATKPQWDGKYWRWALYDKTSGAVFTKYVKATKTTGPDMWLVPHEGRLPNGDPVNLKSQGFSWTPECLEVNMKVYESIYGKRPPNLSGEVAQSNLSIFQQEYKRLLDANPTLSPKEIADKAITVTPFGKHRIAAGYGNFNVTITHTQNLNIGGVMYADFPTFLHIEALPVVRPLPPANLGQLTQFGVFTMSTISLDSEPDKAVK